jgi:uncharacterized repeat protein (TIGR04138 family)
MPGRNGALRRIKHPRPRKVPDKHMQKIGFSEAVETIIQTDTRFEREAYHFLKDALDFTTKNLKKSGGPGQRHVSGRELMDGVREYALKEFGPMASTVLGYWGLRTTEDIGVIVFNLITVGIFGRSDDDSIEQFAAGYDFREAFIEPFLPESRKIQKNPSRVTDQLI